MVITRKGFLGTIFGGILAAFGFRKGIEFDLSEMAADPGRESIRMDWGQEEEVFTDPLDYLEADGEVDLNRDTIKVLLFDGNWYDLGPR